MNNYARYATGVILLIIAVLLIVLGFRAIQGVFSNDEPNKETQQTEQRKVRVADAAKDNKPVEYTMYGPVVANEEFRSIRITADRTVRKVEVLQGYNQAVIKTQSYSNTQEAYQAFVDALQGAGFSNEIKRENSQNEMEVCPLGKRYTYVINPSVTSDRHRTWSSSCSNSHGTFNGNRSTVEKLFQEQIPDYSKFVSGVKL